ncbi:aminotransferase class IV [Alteromonas facilis]|uniref:aminotransferase class IV n=1 Tax=Alteromonas facilis TaxID=2048004 RepID=UPI000C28F7E5|nr:aminotransferase class IV [Alteromonas facilis]
MTIAYLNGNFLPLEEARISPLDRGFLFGDGIYEVIPSYAGKLVGGGQHAARMNKGLHEISIDVPEDDAQWLVIARELVDRNTESFPSRNIGIYLHVSRGTDTKRFHAYPENVSPTVFAFAFEIPPSKPADTDQVEGLKVVLNEDLRWRRCHIKSTSLLGNVLHFQQSQIDGVNETILYNDEGYITEASVCNVFAVVDGEIVTPPLDHQLLPGITRYLVIESLKEEGIVVIERPLHKSELSQASEIWLTSSSKEIAPVIEVDGERVGNGHPGPKWEEALRSYHSHKFHL